MSHTNLERLSGRLVLPLIAAPMFLVSGVKLVTAACCAGVAGTFPTANCRSAEELDHWLHEIKAELDAHEQRTGRKAAPFGVNLIVHSSNARLAEDLEVVRRHKPEFVITSVGSPATVVPPLRDINAMVLADVASLKHCEKALAAGADGLILLTAGAGGQTGWLNPFAFVRAVRALYDGPVVLAGGVSDGAALFAAQCLGCDLAYMGTKFIATEESLASEGYKHMLAASSADDIFLTRAFTGLETNMLRPSIVAAGLDPDALPARGALNIEKDISIKGRTSHPQRWRDIWTAGHSVSGVRGVVPVADLVAETASEYHAARQRFVGA